MDCRTLAYCSRYLHGGLDRGPVALLNLKRGPGTRPASRCSRWHLPGMCCGGTVPDLSPYGKCGIIANRRNDRLSDFESILAGSIPDSQRAWVAVIDHFQKLLDN